MPVGPVPEKERSAHRERAHILWRPVAEYLGRAPGTHVLFLLLTVTTLVLRGVDGPTATRILRQESTNLVQLSRDAPRVLFLSAVLLDQGRLLKEFLLFTLVLVPLERWVGTYRWLVAFAAGHVGATFATTIGIWLQARSGGAGRDLVYPVDVGTSYGLYAAAGMVCFRLPRPVSAVCAAGLGLTAVGGVVHRSAFSDWGHLAAVAIGYALGLLARPETGGARPERRQPVSRVTALWDWLATPPPVPHAGVRRRAGLVTGTVLVAVAAGLLALLGADRDRSVVVPQRGQLVQATVLGRSPGCDARCPTVIVRYAAAGRRFDVPLTLPAQTFVRPHDHLMVRVDPAAPDRPRLPRPARRLNLDGLLGAVAVAAAGVGVTALLAARRASDSSRPLSA